jgi:hypothetical protein
MPRCPREMKEPSGMSPRPKTCTDPKLVNLYKTMKFLAFSILFIVVWFFVLFGYYGYLGAHP